MKEFVVWEVQKWDGGDQPYHTFYLSSEEEKNKYLKNNKYDAAYQKTITITIQKTITIYDTLDEIAKDSYESAKAKAKEALTAKQRKALGLDF